MREASLGNSGILNTFISARLDFARAGFGLLATYQVFIYGAPERRGT